MTEVLIRPNFSSEYIIKRLAIGKAKVMPNWKVSDLVIVKPRWARMFGSQPPIPRPRHEECEKADHRGDDPAAVAAEDDTDRIAADVREPIIDQLLAGRRPAQPHPLEHIQCALPWP